MKKNFYSKHLFFALTFIVLFISSSLNAQLSFTDRSDLLNPGDYYSGVSVGISDMNGDGLDDIVRLGDGRILFIEYQKSDGTGFETLEVGPVSSSSQWTMSIADIDNNGYNDVMTAGFSDGVKIIMAESTGTLSYSSDVYPGTAFFAQGSNFADIDNDGWIDAFVCDDDAESKIWKNDGLGKMLEANELINMATIPSSDNSGNYGSVWTDFDNDGDLDLYIAKCRQGATEPTDPRRINALYVNDGNNVYTERAAEFGLKIGAQSWTAEFQDIDNDGDMDCFINNHDTRNQMLENDGNGNFTDISFEAGMDIVNFPLQGLMRDFDNDGFVDLVIAGDAFHYYRNNGDKTFTDITENMFNEDEIHSYGIGDLNHDGFLDIYASYATGFTSPSNTPDLLWLNDGNDNNYLAINLEGVESNRNGIGARLEIYGDWGIQVREVRAGESYGIHNSFSQHFGLGTATMVDSLIIKWPSGIVDKIEDIPANQFLGIQEGGCVSPNSNLTLEGSATFCNGDSLIITAPDGYTYLWSNGEETQTIVIYETGNYQVTVTDDNGCKAVSQTITSQVDPQQIPEITLIGEAEFCPRTSVTLASTPSSEYTWSNGEETQFISVSDPGEYWVTVKGLCGDFQSEEITLTVLDVPTPATENDTVVNMGKGILKATGEDLKWYASETDDVVLATGPEYLTPIVDQTTTYWVEDLVDFSEPTLFAGKTDQSALGTYENVDFRGLTISIEEPILVKSMKVYAEEAGIRKVRIYDSGNGSFLGNLDIDVPVGESRIDINLEFPASDEIFVFINSDAGLYYDEDQTQINFPYPLGEWGEIVNSSDGNYYYFYDWEIEVIEKYTCSSERSPAMLVVETSVSTADLSLNESVSIFPNPASDQIFMEVDLAEMSNVQILDLQGRLLYTNQLAGASRQELNVADWAAGVYFVKITAGTNVFTEKIVLQK